MDLITQMVNRHIADAIHASGYSARYAVESAVGSLCYRDYQQHRLVFNFSNAAASEWTQPGMIAGVIRERTSRSLQERVFFVLNEGGEVPLKDFIAKSEDARKKQAHAAGLADTASWKNINEHLRVCVKAGVFTEEQHFAFFRNRHVYDLSA